MVVGYRQRGSQPNFGIWRWDPGCPVRLCLECGVRLVFGDGCDLDDSYEFAKKYNLIDNIEGWIPGIGEVRSEMFTGLFHFVHIGAGINRFNDIRGMNHARAGASYPGAMDITILASSDVSGLSLNAYASDGDDRYGQYDKVSRTVAAWQAHTIGHLEWSPVDNLARYGWERFARDGFTRADALAWPLHAIGDVVEPHHVVGTSSWGHRPYEDIVDNQEEVFFPLGGDARRGQLERILVEGFRLWKRFRFEQNISSFIESLAAETRTDVSLSGDWPYQDWPSVVYTFDGSEGEDQFDWEGTRTRCECCSSVSVR